MREGLYAIEMPVTELIEYTGITGDIVSELSLTVDDWPGLRRDVREGQEILLVASVPEQEAVLQLSAVVTEFDDDFQMVKVVV